MKKQSRTVPRRRQSVSPTPRHLPLVDILIDTQAELQELVVASGLKVLEAMLEEDRAAVCGPRYAHQPARQAYRTGHTPSQVVLGGRKVAIRRPRARRAGEEVPLPTARAFANADPLNGVGARMRAGLRASNRRARHLPMRYETGLPSSVIRFRTLHASTASRRCPDELRARRQSPTIDVYRKNACSTRAC